MHNEVWSFAEISCTPCNLAEISVMAATERNEVILGEGIAFQETKVLIDTINAVCLIETVIEDPQSRKKKKEEKKS